MTENIIVLSGEEAREKEPTGWTESHKYLALFLFAGVPFIAVQGLKLLLIALFPEAVNQVIFSL